MSPNFFVPFSAYFHQVLIIISSYLDLFCYSQLLREHRFFQFIYEYHHLDLQYSSPFLEFTLSRLPLSHSFLLISHLFLLSSSLAPHSLKPYSLHHLSCYHSNSSPVTALFLLISELTPLFSNFILPFFNFILLFWLIILQLSQLPHLIQPTIHQSSPPSLQLSNPQHLLFPMHLLISTPLLLISTKIHQILH